MHQALHSSCLRALLCGDEEPTLTEQKTRSMAEGHNEEAAGPSKKARREYKHQHEWQSHGIFRSCKGKNFALCKTCNVDINVSQGVYQM